ncbi:MAG TPA: DUF448 domain-containing protein [Mycobacteriales bacterium]|nr:DUF448 domain-containing protein [Mycobacteriales bacterium]
MARVKAVPARTCVGCRQCVAATELLRVVVVEGVVVPDPRRRMPGRGAWVHQDMACVDLAIRRRAFARAARVAQLPDPTAVREYVAGQAGELGS